jgi:WD40 repeat protein
MPLPAHQTAVVALPAAGPGGAGSQTVSSVPLSQSPLAGADRDREDLIRVDDGAATFVVAAHTRMPSRHCPEHWPRPHRRRAVERQRHGQEEIKMGYTVRFHPTDADYRILKKRGDAYDRDVYPIVSKSGFQSREEAQAYIDSNWNPAIGRSREAYSIIPGTFPDPDRTGWQPITVKDVEVSHGRRDRRSGSRHGVTSSRRRRRIIIGISLLAVAGAIASAIVLLTGPGPHGNDYYVAVSPDGKFIASASSLTDNVYLWDTASRRVIATLADPHRATDSINAIALSPDGAMIAVAHTNDPVYIWNIATRRVVATITPAAGASGLAFSPDGKTLAICNGNVLLWNVGSGRVEAALTAVKNSADGGAVAAAFSPDGRTLAVSISDNTDQNGKYLAPGIELWDIATRRVTSDLKGGTGGGAITYTRDGRALAATELGGGSFSLWAVTGTPRLKAEPSLPQPNVREYSPIGNGPVAFSPDGATLATADGSPANSAYLFDVATGQMTATLTDPGSLAIADLAYTPDGRTLITADGNGNIYLWNLGTRQVTATLTTPNS